MTSYSGLIANIFWNLKIKNLHHQFLHCYNSTNSVSTYPKFVPVSPVVCKFFILSQRVCEVDPPCYVTINVSTVQNVKHSSSCYDVISVTSVKVCNFFVSCQSVCEVDSIHVDVVHVTTDSILKHWNAIFLCQPRIHSASVNHISNVITYVNKSHEGDCPCVISFDMSTTTDPVPIDVLQSYDEIERITLFLFPMLKVNVVIFISLLFMAFVFSLRTIFIFCPILKFRLSVFTVNIILTFFRYCYYSIQTNIAYVIYYNLLMILTTHFWPSQHVEIFSRISKNVFDLWLFANYWQFNTVPFSTSSSPLHLSFAVLCILAEVLCITVLLLNF